MKQLTKMEKLLDHYETELELWKISKKKARSMGQPLPVQNFNIARIEEKIVHLQKIMPVKNYNCGECGEEFSSIQGWQFHQQFCEGSKKEIMK